MRYILPMFLVVFQLACAATGYLSGIDDTQLDQNVFKVRFKGNRYTSVEKVKDYTLLRCAELALVHRYKFFVILDSDSYSKNFHVISGMTVFPVTKPRSENTIMCFVEKPKGFSYNATFVFESLSEKYNLK